MGTISAQRRGSRTYYVYRESYRVKVDPIKKGKGSGSGRSKVRSRAVYLGTAEAILKCFERTKEPVEVATRRFGLIAAAYQTAAEIGLPEILKMHITGERAKVAHWTFFFISIINRIDNATSKNKMSQWLSKTILPELLGLDPAGLTCKDFWYAADYVLAESDSHETRERSGSGGGPLLGLNEDIYTRIEKGLFSRIDQLMGLKTLMGIECTLVLTYNSATKRKKQHSLKRGIEKLKREMFAKWAAYKKRPKSLAKGLLTLKQKSRYGKFLESWVEDDCLQFREKTQEIEEREKGFGK